MAGKTQIQGKVVINYLEKFPTVATRAIARKIYNENIELFANYDAARKVVQYYRGSIGGGSKERNERLGRTFQTPEPPVSYAEKREDFILPKGVTRLGILSDIHLPYHDEAALIAAVNHLKDQKVNGLLLNGDTLDFHGVSFHEKDPRARRISEEIETWKQFIAWIKHELSCPIYFKIGNHEQRLVRYMQVKAPELLDLPNFNLSEILEFGKHGIIEIGSLQRIKAGKFTIYHGHEFKGSGGVYPARWLALKSRISSAVGHFHKESQFTWKNSDGTDYVCYSFGCLCDLSPDYLPENDWTQGCAVLHIDAKTGEYVMKQARIVNGKVYA